MKKLFLLLLGISLLTGCKKDPVADFSYSGTLIVGTNVDFKNLSENTGSCHWDFGDGTESTDMDPIHRYEKPGSYNVTLSAEGNGKSVSKTSELIITGVTYSYYNSTEYKLYGLISFFPNGYYINDYNQHGTLESGQTTGVSITSNLKVAYAFKFYTSSQLYMQLYPYSLQANMHNNLVIADTNTLVGITISSSPDKPAFNNGTSQPVIKLKDLLK